MHDTSAPSRSHYASLTILDSRTKLNWFMEREDGVGIEIPGLSVGANPQDEILSYLVVRGFWPERIIQTSLPHSIVTYEGNTPSTDHAKVRTIVNYTVEVYTSHESRFVYGDEDWISDSQSQSDGDARI